MKTLNWFIISSLTFLGFCQSLNLSQSELKLTWRPLDQGNRYPRYLLKNIVHTNGRTFDLVCYFPKRAECFEAIKIWRQNLDNSDLEQQESRNMNIGDISNTGNLEKGNSFPENKVWVFGYSQNQKLHCYPRGKAKILEKLGKRYGC